MSIVNAWCFTFVKAKVTRIATLLCHRDCWKFYVTTGSGGNPRRICFPVTTASGANNRLVQKRCTTRFAKQRDVRESRKRCIRICCVTVGQPTCWNAAPLCGRFRCCSVTSIWRRRPFISIYPSVICKRSITPSKLFRCPDSVTNRASDRERESEPAHRGGGRHLSRAGQEFHRSSSQAHAFP